jgi:hypothetical protein
MLGDRLCCKKTVGRIIMETAQVDSSRLCLDPVLAVINLLVIVYLAYKSRYGKARCAM